MVALVVSLFLYHEFSPGLPDTIGSTEQSILPFEFVERLRQFKYHFGCWMNPMHNPTLTDPPPLLLAGQICEPQKSNILTHTSQTTEE